MEIKIETKPIVVMEEELEARIRERLKKELPPGTKLTSSVIWYVQEKIQDELDQYAMELFKDSLTVRIAEDNKL